MIQIGTLCLIVHAPRIPDVVGHACTVEEVGFGRFRYGIRIPGRPSEGRNGLWGAESPRHIIPLTPDDIDTQAEKALEVLVQEYSRIKMEE